MTERLELMTNLYEAAVDDVLSFREWEEQYVNPFITQVIKDDQQARMGAFIKMDWVNGETLREFVKDHEDDFYSKKEEDEENLGEWLADGYNVHDAYQQGKNAGWAEAAVNIQKILEE